VQITRFPSFVVVADELALEFDDCRQAFDSNFGWCWSPLQRAAVVALEQYLADMSGPDKPELWLDEDCLDHARWSEVRQLAGKVLYAFGWSPDVPPLDRGAIYVGPPD
jgi:hypothetical protein